MRVSRVRAAVAVGVAAAVTAVTAVAVHTPAAGAAVTPLQVITVRTASAASTTASLEAWQRQSNGVYKRVRATTAYIGAQGVGTASETTSRTPAGQFTLTEAFGINANPGTGLPYRKVDGYDWWVSDVKSPLYNTYRRCLPQNCSFNIKAAERLGAAGAVYGSAAVIDYNRKPVRVGAGSAFFLHVTNNRPTAGCVAVTSVHLVWLLRWLRPASHPIISIGVGAAAYAPIPHRQL